MPEPTPDKTVMTEWAKSSLEFSAAKKKFMDEFGFKKDSDVKWYINRMFPEEYISVCQGKMKIKEWTEIWQLNPEYITAINFAKAILVASALLETNDIREIIEWANT